MKQYFPKQFFQLMTQQPMDCKKILWKQSDPYTFTLSMCLYYEGGQWRHVTSRFDIRDLSYHVSSVFYENHSTLPEGNEITREQWDKKGFSVSSGTKAFSEIIPPNDTEALEWLESKDIIIEIKDKELIPKLKREVFFFLGALRQTIEDATDSEVSRNELAVNIDSVGVTKNANMLREFFDKNPNSKIWNLIWLIIQVSILYLH